MAIGLAFVDIVGDTSRTEGQIERDMSRVLAVVEDTIDPVEIRAAVEAGTGADLQRELRSDIRAAQAALQSVQVNTELSPEARARLAASLRETIARARAAAGDLQVRIDSQAVVTETTVAVVEAVRVAEAVAPPIELEVNIDRDRVSRLGPAFAQLGSLASGALGPITSIGASLAKLGSAVPLVAGVAATLANIAPAAGLAATGIVTVVSATAALKIGMVGVKDAVSAALDPSDPKAYAEAVKNLAPAARDFVGQIRSLQPALDGLRKSVQQELFAGLAGEVKRLGTTLLPTLQAKLKDSAGALNLMARNVTATATGLGKSGTLGQALDSANAGLLSLSAIPSQVVGGLVQVAAAAGPSFARLTDAAGQAAGSLSDKLAGAFASGSLQKAIDQAIGLAGDLFEVIGNVGSIVGSVLGAADATGGGFVGTLKEISGALQAAFASPAVQDGLKALFSTMALVAQTAGPLLAQALGLIGPVLVALAPPVKVLISALGQALQPIIAALGPVLLVAAQAVGQLLISLSPLFPVVGQLVALIGPILVPIIGAFATILAQLAPVVAQVGQLLAAVLTPILAQLPVIITPLLAVFTTLTGALLPVLSQLIVSLAPAITEMSMSFAEVAIALGPLIAQLAVLLGKYLEALLPLLLPIIETVGKLASIFSGELARVVSSVVVPALQTITRLLSGDFSGALDSAKVAVSGWKDHLVRVFVDLPGAIAGALGDLAKSLFNAGNQLIYSLIQGIKSKIPDLGGVLSSVTDFIADHKGPIERDRKLLIPAGVAIMGGLIGAINGERGNLRTALDGVTSMIGGTGMGIPGLAMAGAAGGVYGTTSAASRLAASAGSVNVSAAAPTVQVFVGNREITDIVDVRIASNNRTQGRLVTNGMRS